MMKSKVLLVGWDAADWKVIRPLMAAGRMPNLRRLTEKGATGPITTLHPPLSPMLWTSIATGKRPFKHGIHGFSEPTPDGRGVRPVTNLSRTSKAVWNILNQNGARSLVVGWWPSHPAEPIDGVMVSDRFHHADAPLEEGWPVPANTVYPAALAGGLAGVRVHPDQLTPEIVEPFIPRAREIDQEADKRLSLCIRTIAECMSVHAAAVWLMENQPWDFAAVYLDSIDHFCHVFMRYHPPRQSWIAKRDFDLYHNVVTSAYQFHDRMLGELIEKAGPETRVILMSDHGFHPDHLRPASIPDIPAGPAVEHRELGILALAGPGIKPGTQLYGPSVLDIAPTILTLYGLPVGEDMDGKVLTQAFDTAPEVTSIPSWEQVAGDAGCHPPHTRLDPVASHEALAQMVALGYIEPLGDDREAAVKKTIRELRYNLGEAYQDGGRHAEAHQIFAELNAADPDEQRFAVKLFVSCQALGMLDQMRRIVDDLDGRRRALYEEAQTKVATLVATDETRRELAYWRNLARYQLPVIDYLKAQVLTAENRCEDALAALGRVTEAHLLRPGLFPQTADLYVRLGRWDEARDVYERSLALDPDNAHAHMGLCRLYLRRKEYAIAAKAALDALQRNYHSALAHFLLAEALAGMQDYARAADALRAALSVNPNFAEAHARLAGLLDKHLGNPGSAREHRRLAREMLLRPKRASAQGDASPVVFSEGPVAVSPAVVGPLEECLVVVTGLPRSGTSMVMQMLAAGGMPIRSDGLREADEDNPRGYLEFDPIRKLFEDSKPLLAARGKAVKIIAPLLGALPSGLPCRVILCRRDLDEVLDSQQRMLAHRQQALDGSPESRQRLKAEYARTLARVRANLVQRPSTQWLSIEHREAVTDPQTVARQLNRFLDGRLDIAKMAAAVDPRLHRNRTLTESTTPSVVSEAPV